jgi:hypothetical protein
MLAISGVEALGYLASALVVLALTMRSLLFGPCAADDADAYERVLDL